ncbi:MAG: hypothetical protein JSR58_01830 [Verrucomicrobia bacterium]|nr:hypothetical protein [Verrucomicrobiota bacterium]
MTSIIQPIFSSPSKITSFISNGISHLIAKIEKAIQKTTPEKRFSLPPEYSWGAEMNIGGERLTFITFEK